MPNVKLFTDETLVHEHGKALRAILPELRALLCRDLAVDEAACQIALLPVIGLAGQPPVNVEILALPKPDRTPDAMQKTAERIRALILPAVAGAAIAVRVSMLDPGSYVALK